MIVELRQREEIGGNCTRRAPAPRRLLAASVAIAVTAAATASSGVKAKPTTFTPVIVRANPAAEPRVEGVTRALGGRVQTRLAIVNGFSAIVPSASVAKLAPSPACSPSPRTPRSSRQARGYDPADDANSMASTTSATGAAPGGTPATPAQGVDVAVIDTGVSPVPGLDGSDKLVYGPDLSLDSQAPNLAQPRHQRPRHVHGRADRRPRRVRTRALLDGARPRPTSAWRPTPGSSASRSARADGGVDVSQVIAAIDWVVQHAHDPGLNIRVLNLSYGTNSTQPLPARSARLRGRAGVEARDRRRRCRRQHRLPAGQRRARPRRSGLRPVRDRRRRLRHDGHERPGDDSSATAPQVAPCCGPIARACTGSALQGPGPRRARLAPPGSARPRLVRRRRTTPTAGSAAASSAAAAPRRAPRSPRARPRSSSSGTRELTPDQVKRYLQDSAGKLKGSGTTRAGRRRAPASTSGRHARGRTARTRPSRRRPAPGSLELSRGQDHLTRDGVVLIGRARHLRPADRHGRTAQPEASGSSWSGGTWNGSSWSGSSWSGSSWSGSSWSGSSWSGSSGSSWSGSSWSGSSWSGSSWSGSSWSDASWS